MPRRTCGNAFTIKGAARQPNLADQAAGRVGARLYRVHSCSFAVLLLTPFSEQVVVVNQFPGVETHGLKFMASAGRKHPLLALPKGMDLGLKSLDELGVRA